MGKESKHRPCLPAWLASPCLALPCLVLPCLSCPAPDAAAGWAGRAGRYEDRTGAGWCWQEAEGRSRRRWWRRGGGGCRLHRRYLPTYHYLGRYGYLPYISCPPHLTSPHLAWKGKETATGVRCFLPSLLPAFTTFLDNTGCCRPVIAYLPAYVHKYIDTYDMCGKQDAHTHALRRRSRFLHCKNAGLTERASVGGLCLLARGPPTNAKPEKDTTPWGLARRAR
ncbi:hypothetical protein LX32DRAFT_40 [Colletotrichum zoysiae]|uniref:Uncharacterized protein n=1 Tax=Colletotrichum zoysiae TaxID=1216348 RepID=A0AAD9M6P0_9PEZI|nr:hypothetical protein LX32DRAFT_40 [Colletotrichum zoysiae]